MKQVRVQLDLSQAVLGLNFFTIKNENIKLPPGVVLKTVVPQEVEVTLDVPTQKVLPVQVDWTGELLSNLILESIRLEPKEVKVIGGKLVLENISTIYTEKISLDAIRTTGKMTVNIALNPVSLKIAPDSTDKITIHFVVKQRQ